MRRTREVVEVLALLACSALLYTGNAPAATAILLSCVVLNLREIRQGLTPR